uniref:U2A'/phosphoprotein 32 family A C-terminal domain-containing protein n=1 Tax=Kalanchoe fedtschenkoi TaxID=63787 RepID=A0A7N0SYU4_KALFE
MASKGCIFEGSKEKCDMKSLVEKLKDADLLPLASVFLAIYPSGVDELFISHESPYVLTEGHVLSLLRASTKKLRIIDLQGLQYGKDFMRELSRGGLSCRVLNLLSPHMQKLDMHGKFMKLHTLNLDFCVSLTSLEQDCFTCVPNLKRLSMCETRVANLWTTSASLSKLPNLIELRFQNCSCCKDTRPCSSASQKDSGHLMRVKAISDSSNAVSFDNNMRYYDCGRLGHTCQTDRTAKSSESLCNTSEGDECSDGSAEQCSRNYYTIILSEISSNDIHASSDSEPLDKVSFKGLLIKEEEAVGSSIKKNLVDSLTMSGSYTSHHPSPICFEKHYREYMIASLPRLKVLDNRQIIKKEKDGANHIFAKYFECLPYGRATESITNVLHNRELGARSALGSKLANQRTSQQYFSRSISAAKVGSATWPLMHTLHNYGTIPSVGNKRLRPRQFEYHPSDPILMAFGTLDGDVLVINHENGNITGCVASCSTTSVLGLCWLKKYPSKILAGSDNGSLKLYDINHLPPKTEVSNVIKFDRFEQLTSVTANMTDDQFLVSGFSKNVALYDISTGKRLHLFTDMHREPINVAKFAHRSPYMFATSSFDRDIKMWDLRQDAKSPCYTATSSKGNVMVCFSPDDHYLLVSAVDNEVKQLLAADGRVHMDFGIPSTGSTQNYTRSYYMNRGDYVISGSCDEHVVRICCAQTGRRLKDVCFKGTDTTSPALVQTLRSDPFRDFHMSILGASKQPHCKWDIIKVNLLSSSHSAEKD